MTIYVLIYKNVVHRDLDMKSNILNLMKTPNLAIFDGKTAFNLGLVLQEIYQVLLVKY